MPPDRWADLGLNLLAEALGIIATVFLVDRIIKKREDARWKPSKHFVYSKLVEITSNLFTTILPISIQRQTDYFIYEFGEIRSFPALDMDKVDLSDEKLKSQLYTDLGSSSIGNWIKIRNDMTEIQERMDEVIGDSAFFLEPEILSLLLTLRNEIDNFVVRTPKFSGAAANGHLSEDVFFPIAYSISQLLTAAKNVERWLVNQSTRKLTYEDFRRELLEKSTKL